METLMSRFWQIFRENRKVRRHLTAGDFTPVVRQHLTCHPKQVCSVRHQVLQIGVTGFEPATF